MKKILLIEDDAVMRENTTEILELASFDVHTASNGKEGCRIAKELKPELIVCDIMMPELDGYGVLQILSRDPSTASIPFILLTAKAEKSDMRKGMELGADDYLTKPFEEVELLNAIEARFKKSRIVRKKYDQSFEGLNHFLETARSLKKLKNLSQKRSIVKLKKEQIIYSVGDTPQYLYYLNKGKIKVFKINDEGKEYITDVYTSGEFFGTHPLLEKTLYSNFAVSLEESEICKVPKKDFLILLYKNRDVAIQFIKMLSNSLEEKERQLLSLAYDSVRKRTANTLVQLSNKYQKEGFEKTRIRLTRDDLAAMTGTAKETVIRCLSEFKSDQLIEIKGREITILDAEALASIPY